MAANRGTSDRARVDRLRAVLRRYRDLVAAGGSASASEIRRARAALVALGSDGDHAAWSLADYDHGRFGPYLGVSDEGSAAAVIRRAAFASPKAQVLGTGDPTVLGMALDAERLGGVGEVPVGPEEYADGWLECIDRILMSTNVGTRANVRFYKHEPVVVVPPGAVEEVLDAAKLEVSRAFEPFLATPNRVPRPLTVLIALDERRPRAESVRILEALRAHAARPAVAARRVHRLGLLAKVPSGPRGREAAKRAIDLARAAGIGEVALDGKVRPQADAAVSLPGLLNYLAPGLLGPVLRHAKKRKIVVRPKNTVDPESVARSIWSALNTARGMGLHLGKYGVFPLTLEESDAVVADVQRWFPGWSAAPVFFVDQGLLSRDRVDVGRDVARGLRTWLEAVAKRGVRVVLVDTVDKAGGWKLRRSGAEDEKGLLGPKQIRDIDVFAARLGVKVLWAGGLNLSNVYEMGKLGVFGVYVTSAASEGITVPKAYARDPALASVKEPTFEGVARTKLLLEAGFLGARIRDRDLGGQLDELARALLRALETRDAGQTSAAQAELAARTCAAWKSWTRRAR